MPCWRVYKKDFFSDTSYRRQVGPPLYSLFSRTRSHCFSLQPYAHIAVNDRRSRATRQAATATQQRSERAEAPTAAAMRLTLWLQPLLLIQTAYSMIVQRVTGFNESELTHLSAGGGAHVYLVS